MSVITVEIDRIMLSGIEPTSVRAERIRELIEVELCRLLEWHGLPEGLSSGEISHLETRAMRLVDPQSDLFLAGSIARSIVQALRGIE